MRKRFDRKKRDLQPISGPGVITSTNSKSSQSRRVDVARITRLNVDAPEHSFSISEAVEARGVPVQTFYHQGGHGRTRQPMKMNEPALVHPF